MIENLEVKTNSAKQVLEGLGLDPDEVISAWNQTTVSQDALLERNLGTLGVLREVEPFAPRVLTERFGIRNFARYPEEVLIDLYRRRDDTNNPYMVWVNPEYDFNGEFYKFKGKIGELHTLLRGEVSLRIIESGSSDQFIESFDSIKRDYGQAAGAVIGGHGSHDSIQLGVKEDLKFDDLRRGSESLRKAFVEGPSIVLVSCSTGKEGGIGQELSRIVEGKVTAPVYRTSLERVVPILEPGRVDFKVDFTHDPSIRYRDYPLRGDKMVYISGRPQAA